jgi:hypothetical protein
MNTASITDETAASTSFGRTALVQLGSALAAVTAVAGAYALARSGLFKAGDDLGYGIGVAGGVLMLLLMLYPARKYLRLMRNAGHVKLWFWMHMVCGIAGPWLILVHSTFRVGSLNAGVALYSMLIVVASGLVGRFLFARVQQQLDGGQASLRQRREQLGLAGSQARSMFAFAPAIEARLQAFEQRELPSGDGRTVPLLQLLAVPLRHALEQRRCRTQLDQALLERAQAEAWSDEQLRQRRARVHRSLRRYFDAVLRVAHFSLFDRLFALWHVAHMPFVVLLAISAVVHVVAVHAY